MLIFIIVLAALIVLFLLNGLYFSNKVIYPKTFSHEEAMEYEIDAGRLDKAEFESLAMQEVCIKSPFGYDLYALFLPSETHERAVILCHGITHNLFGCVKYVDMFRGMGFNILLFDQRNHGRSGGTYTTYGLREKYDLKACMDWILEKCGPKCITGIFGESMGASVALQHASLDPRVSFCIADCPYSDLLSILKIRFRYDYRLPPFPFIPLSDFFTSIRTGMHFRDVSPVTDVKRITAPVFFIHGLDDGYIPPKMSIEMHEVKNGTKKLYLAPDACHVRSYWSNREEYEEQVKEFFHENGII